MPPAPGGPPGPRRRRRGGGGYSDDDDEGGVSPPRLSFGCRSSSANSSGLLRSIDDDASAHSMESASPPPDASHHSDRPPPPLSDRLGPGRRGSEAEEERAELTEEEEYEARWDPDVARTELRRAASELSRRGLGAAARWCAEQLVGLAPPPPSSSPGDAGTPRSAPPSRGEEEMEDDATLYAAALLDGGEYGRAAAALSAPPGSDSPPEDGRGFWGGAAGGGEGDDGVLPILPPLPNLSPLGIYLRAWALYMAGERRKEEEAVELRDPLERTSVRNAHLPQLSAELYQYYRSGSLDAFGLYAYGVVLKQLDKSPALVGMPSPRSPRSGVARGGGGPPTAHAVLIESLIMFPCNWSAWLDLSQLCVDDPSIHLDVEDGLRPISAHWMYHFFCVHVFLENQANENAVVVIERLRHGTKGELSSSSDGISSIRGMFIRSPYLQSQLAVAHYNMRDFDAAQDMFAALMEWDPHRLDQMDVYSNILYVKEDKVGLSQLAHRAVRIDKYRPETCCIVGNYYSLRGRHERAVTYFQRALKLDRTYLSAWTLMGHEYVEMKNTAAAVEAYRRAVDINPRDYRAWYGLGQTYEILNMLLYALFYYRRSAALRPYDARMWCAVGGCYLGLDRRGDAVRAYERAVSNGDAEGIATRRLAALYREDGDAEGAARCYLRHLELRYQAQRMPSPGGGAASPSGATSIEDTINLVRVDAPEAEALLYLAYYHRDNGEYETAAMCCSRLLEYPGPEKEEGKALLREIRSRMDRRGGGETMGGGGGRRRGGTGGRPGRPGTGGAGLGVSADDSMDASVDPGSSFEFSP